MVYNLIQIKFIRMLELKPHNLYLKFNISQNKTGCDSITSGLIISLKW